jgi:hypothetical protein
MVRMRMEPMIKLRVFIEKIRDDQGKSNKMPIKIWYAYFIREAYK